MATYRNDNQVNVDTFQNYVNDVVSGKVGKITPDTDTIEATALPGALKITAGLEAGRYVRKTGFVLISATPPPPPPPAPVVTRIVTVTIQEDGWKPVTANVTQEKE